MSWIIMLGKLFKKKIKKENKSENELNFTEVFDKIEAIAQAKFIFHDDQYNSFMLIDDFGTLMKNKLDTFSYFYESEELDLFGQINFCAKTTMNSFSLTSIFDDKFLSSEEMRKLHKLIDKDTYIKLAKMNSLFNSFYELLKDELNEDNKLLNRSNNNYKKLSEQFCKLFYIFCCVLANKHYHRFNYEFNDYSSDKIKMFNELINKEMCIYCQHF